MTSGTITCFSTDILPITSQEPARSVSNFTVQHAVHIGTTVLED
jgi:hypothetical protein